MTESNRDLRGQVVSLKDRMISAGLWGVNLSFLVPAVSTMMLLYKFAEPHKLQPIERAYCRFQLALTGNRWRAVVHEDVDPNGVYIFAQNHTNHFDHVTVYNATPHVKQGLELESHFKYPFYGWYMKARGTIPVPADGHNRIARILRRMRKEVERGYSILAFPEGSRTLDGRVGPFKNGIFHMAIELGVPIVPVAVTGMYDVMRKGSLIIRPGNDITVFADKPIPTEGLGRADLPRLRDQTHDVIAKRVNAYFEEQHA